MSRQGDLNDSQHGGARTNGWGDQKISGPLGLSRDLHRNGPSSVADAHSRSMGNPKTVRKLQIQDGDSQSKRKISKPHSTATTARKITKRHTVRASTTPRHVKLVPETQNNDEQQVTATYIAESYDANSVDVVQKVDEWLKQHRSDSQSSIEFDGDVKAAEDYDLIKLVADDEPDVIIEDVIVHERPVATLPSDIHHKTTKVLDLFTTSVPHGLHSEVTKVHHPQVLKGGSEGHDVEILNPNYDDHHLLPQITVMGSFTNESDGTFGPQITSVMCASSTTGVDSHPDVESFINHETLTRSHDSHHNIESKTSPMMDFSNADSIMLMTPQELERMPESGIEFEESVGPKEFENPEKHADVEAVCDMFEQVETAEILPGDLKDSEKNGEVVAETSGDSAAMTNPGSSTLATISITTDTETNTTNIVINTKLGQKAFKINTANLMQAAATLQPITLADLVDQKGTAALAEVQGEIVSVDQSPQEEHPDLHAILDPEPAGCDDKSPSITCLQEEKAGPICTHTGRCKKVWTCPQPHCGKVYTKQCKLKVHMMMHSGVRPYKCEVEGCDWAFTTVYKLKRHLETHCGLKEFICDMDGCSRRFTTIYNLNSHKKLHRQPHSIVCPIDSCNAKFPTRRKMELHMMDHNEVDAPYKCPMETCGKMYYTANSMASHLRVHQKTSFQCSFEGCNKVFDKMSRYKVHMWKHTGERPYVCNFEGCKWAFSSASKLKRHMKKHTGERQYICKEPGCGKSFMRLEHLQGHLITHSGDKPFKCPYESCDAKFTAKSSLYVHLKKHSGSAEKITYPCPIENCDKKYNCKSSLRIHMLRYHTPVLAGAGQLDYVALLSNDDLQDIADVDNFDHIIAQQAPLTVQNEITILDSTGKALVGVQEFLPPVVDQNSLSPSVLNDVSSILTQLREVPALVTNKTPLSETASLSSTHSMIPDIVIPSSHLEMEVLTTSSVLLENNSGSARTDYCSNHLLIDRVRKRKQLQQAKQSLDTTIKSEQLPMRENGKLGLLVPGKAQLTSNDVILTSTAISFHDATNSRTHLIHNHLLSDDTPPPHGDLYQEDGLLTSMANELAVPISLLTESSVSDPAGQGADFGSSSSAVAEFTGTTINLQDLE